MPSELDVCALYNHEWETLQRDREERQLVNSAPSTTELILGYDTLADLLPQIEARLTVFNACLRSLELVAHGSPITCNDLSRTDVGSWGTALKTLNWCDQAAIYLSGCNTGLARTVGTTPQVNGPIAKLLAEAMPFDASAFPHRITVYGAAGYISGSNAAGNLAVSPNYTEGALCWRTDHERYANARAATGAGVWNAFRNW
ncbi:MAG: hypothetical protein ACRENB_01735 [Gemmatimonadales bacterium]